LIGALIFLIAVIGLFLIDTCKTGNHKWIYVEHKKGDYRYCGRKNCFACEKLNPGTIKTIEGRCD
jgi:hypothetical protein